MGLSKTVHTLGTPHLIGPWVLSRTMKNAVMFPARSRQLLLAQFDGGEKLVAVRRQRGEQRRQIASLAGSPATISTLKGSRILLAEDNIVNQEVALALLDSVGLQVDIASDGEEAVQMASTVDYALILMDVQMPVMDGLDATRAIRCSAVDRRVPILAMTANAFAEERERCLDAGMNDHVAKPVVAEHLFSTLNFWLSRKADV